MRAPLLTALIVLATAGAASARQAPLSSLDDLRRALARDDRVTIVRRTGGPIQGRVVRVGDATLDIDAPGQPAAGRRQRQDLSIPWTDLVSLERPRDSSRNGALIGASVGGGFWLAMFVYGAAVDYNEIDEWAGAFLAAGAISAGIGALAGWAIDRAHSKPPIRFALVSSRTVTIRAVPWRGRGAAIVLSF